MATVDISQICLDTGPLIHYLRGREPGASIVEKAVIQFTCYVSAITVYELLFGVARARTRPDEQALLNVMRVLPFDDRAARQAAQLHADLIRNNQEIGIKDVLIAAICLENDLPLLTTNERHFNRVTGLRVFPLSVDIFH